MSDPFIIQEDNKNIKDKKLNSYYEQRYVGEQSNLFNRNSLIYSIFNQKKLAFLFVFIILFFLSAIVRIGYLQLYQGKLFIALAEGNRLKTEVIKANRGLIYDINGDILAKNIPSFSLVFYPNEIRRDELDEKLNEISSWHEFDLVEVKNNYTKYQQYSNQPITILDNLTTIEALDIKLLIREFHGFYVFERSERYYPYGNKISHLLGYLGNITESDIEKVRRGEYLLNDKLGKSGLELFYENSLKGVDGRKSIEVNVFGEELKVISEQRPNGGLGLILNIDYQLQEIAYESLQKVLTANRLSKGVVVGMDPRNGAVRAVVSIPTYDNNFFISPSKHKNELADILTDVNNPLFFRAVQGEYPSGSVIKPFYAAAGLQEKIINQSTTIISTGGIRVAQWFFPDWKYGGHGSTNVVKAIAESVNTFFYYLGGGYEKFNGLGIENLKKYAEYFGFYTYSQIDFPQERKGFFPSPEWKLSVKKEQWYIGDTYNTSIGQGDVLVTPLQIANALSALINDGLLYEPRFLYGFKDEKTGEVEVLKPEVLREIPIDNVNLNIVKSGLRATVLAGSAQYLQNLSVNVAGKTGTAQVGGQADPHAWFVGYAPYESPELVIVILLENGVEGSTFAVPVAFDIFKQYFATDLE
jgi:penicillin-binding protein 2